MEFKWAWALPALLAVPFLVALYWRVQRRRAAIALRYASPTLVHEVLRQSPGWRRHLTPGLLVTALAFVLFSVARPTAVVSYPAMEGTVVLAIDVSGSMRAQDIRPSRIEAAQAAARRFVNQQRGNDSLRIGIVAFSDAAFIVDAPNTNRDESIAAINGLRPQRGTAVGRGILASLDAMVDDPGAPLPSDEFYQQKAVGPSASAAPDSSPTGVLNPEAIVLLTDGVNTRPPDPLSVIDEATRRGVRIYTIGLGTSQGAPITGGAAGGGGFGRGRVQARFDPTTLKQIAAATDAEYYDASSAEDLAQIYDRLSTQALVRTEKAEISSVFVGLAAMLTVAGSAFSLHYFRRLL